MKAVKLDDVRVESMVVTIENTNYKVKSPAGTYLIPRVYLAKLKSFKYNNFHYSMDGLEIPFYVVEACIFRLENLMSHPSYNLTNFRDQLPVMYTSGDYVICKAHVTNFIAEGEELERSKKYLHDLSDGKEELSLDGSVKVRLVKLTSDDAYLTSNFIIGLQEKYKEYLPFGETIQSLVCNRMAQAIADSLKGTYTLDGRQRMTEKYVAQSVALKLSVEIGDIDVFVDKFVKHLLTYSDRADLYEIIQNCQKE